MRRSMHFMMLGHALAKLPGRYRPGPICVQDEQTGAIVYEGPDAADVPELVTALVADLGRLGANTDDYGRVLALTGAGAGHSDWDTGLWVSFILRAHHMHGHTRRSGWRRWGRCGRPAARRPARWSCPRGTGWRSTGRRSGTGSAVPRTASEPRSKSAPRAAI